VIRLFVAIDLPAEISAFIEDMGIGIPGARPVPTDQLHLTLKFIGKVEKSKLHDIKDALAEIHSCQFPLCLKGVGHFPPRGNPTILWVGISPILEIVSLRNRIENLLHHHGIPREGRKFSPHITIARLKNSPAERVARFIAGNNLLVTPEFMVRSFMLYASSLTQKGAIHTMQEIYSLDAG
jgi:RNA 2',3'-cyclic 3'-phosphodiesterase